MQDAIVASQADIMRTQRKSFILKAAEVPVTTTLSEVLKFLKTIDAYQDTQQAIAEIEAKIQQGKGKYGDWFDIIFAGLIDALGYDREKDAWIVFEAKATNLGTNADEELNIFKEKRWYYLLQIILYLSAVKNGHFPRHFEPMKFVDKLINIPRTENTMSQWHKNQRVEGYFVFRNTNQDAVQSYILQDHIINWRDIYEQRRNEVFTMFNNLIDTVIDAIEFAKSIMELEYARENFYYTPPLIAATIDANAMEDIDAIPLFQYHNNSIHKIIRNTLKYYTPFRKALQAAISDDGLIIREEATQILRRLKSGEDINSILKTFIGKAITDDGRPPKCSWCSFYDSCPHARLISHLEELAVDGRYNIQLAVERIAYHGLNPHQQSLF